jgi:hypothetical protein
VEDIHVPLKLSAKTTSTLTFLDSAVGFADGVSGLWQVFAESLPRGSRQRLEAFAEGF